MITKRRTSCNRNIIEGRRGRKRKWGRGSNITGNGIGENVFIEHNIPGDERSLRRKIVQSISFLPKRIA